VKVVIKLLIAALIANGTWRVGSAYAAYYKFKDAVASTTQHRGAKTDVQLRERVFELAKEYDVPIDENLTVTKQDNHTIVDGSFTWPIDIVPGFKYDWPFTVHVDTFIIEPPKLDGSPIG
jgi:hypothetical protein